MEDGTDIIGDLLKQEEQIEDDRRYGVDEVNDGSFDAMSMLIKDLSEKPVEPLKFTTTSPDRDERAPLKFTTTSPERERADSERQPLKFTTNSLKNRLDEPALRLEDYEEEMPDADQARTASQAFDKAFEQVLVAEGGYSDVKEDRGGATNLGITLKTLREHRPGATKEDVKNLTAKEAKEIYKKDYWDAGKVDELPEHIQHVVFDMNVNHGQGNSNKIVQRALKSLGEDIGIDGKIGKKTLEALEKYDPSLLLNSILEQRGHFYRKIIKNDPSQKRFLKGWMNRLAGLKGTTRLT